MRVGFLQVYNEVDWIEYAIKQALKLSDKLIIIEGSQFTNFRDIPLHSDDGTLEIIHRIMENYPKDIELITTIRKFNNYRQNQAANFNLALKKCKIGDYLLPLDADDFYFDEYIDKIIEITEDGEVDYLKASGLNFAFSFNWIIKFENNEFYFPQVLFKKNRKLKFKPTHTPIKYGHNFIFDKSLACLNHYKWVKPTERMRIRHLTSGYHKNMNQWFEENWNKIELIENKKFSYFDWDFHLTKYNGDHPEILKDHPWRNLSDIRKINNFDNSV